MKSYALRKPCEKYYITRYTPGICPNYGNLSGGTSLKWGDQPDQQTRTSDQTFEGSRTQLPTSARGTATPICGSFLPNYAKSLGHTCNVCTPELVYEVSSKLDNKWLSYEPKPYAHIWTYAPNLINFGP